MKRPGTMSDDERALIHRKTPPRGAPIVENWDGDTDQLDPDERREMRSLRPDRKRIERLEEKHDGLADDVNDIKVAVADIRGDQKAQNASLASIEKTLERQAQREHVTFTARVDVDKAQQLDVIDAKRTKRALIAKIVGAALGGAGLLEVLKRLLA